MTLTDQSELFLTYDGFYHGYSGNGGEISIDQPYIGSAYTAGVQTLLNLSVGLNQSNTVQGQLAVPNGPGWDGKLGLKAKCSLNVYEHVIEWVPAGAVAPVQASKTPGTTAPDQSSEPGTGSGGLSWIVIVGGLAIWRQRWRLWQAWESQRPLSAPQRAKRAFPTAHPAQLCFAVERPHVGCTGWAEHAVGYPGLARHPEARPCQRPRRQSSRCFCRLLRPPGGNPPRPGRECCIAPFLRLRQMSVRPSRFL